MRLLIALSALLLASCSPSGHSIILRVVSDIAPGVEAASVTTEMRSGGQSSASVVLKHLEKLIQRTDTLARGIDVASLDGVESGTHTFVVELLRANGERIAARPFVVDVTGDATYTIVVSADCASVECPAAGSPSLSACLAGQCVDPRCTVDTPEFCPTFDFCDADSDCASESVATCATSKCSAGVCVETPDDNACADTEYCAPGEGCAPADMPAMPGGADPRCGRVCALDDAPCEYGYYRCDSESRSAVCVPFVHRPVGAPCGDGLSCDEAAMCVESREMDAAIDAGTADAAMDAPREAGRDSGRDAARDMSAVDATTVDMTAVDMSPPPAPRIRFTNMTSFGNFELVLDDGATTVATSHCGSCGQPYHVTVPEGIHDVTARETDCGESCISATLENFDAQAGHVYTCLAYGEFGMRETLAVMCFEDRDSPTTTPAYRIVNLMTRGDALTVTQSTRDGSDTVRTTELGFAEVSPIIEATPSDGAFHIDHDSDGFDERVFVVSEFADTSVFTNFYLTGNIDSGWFNAILNRATSDAGSISFPPTTVAPVITASSITSDVSPIAISVSDDPRYMYDTGDYAFGEATSEQFVTPAYYDLSVPDGSSSVVPLPSILFDAGTWNAFVVYDSSPGMGSVIPGAYRITHFAALPYWIAEGSTRVLLMHTSSQVGVGRTTQRPFRLDGAPTPLCPDLGTLIPSSCIFDVEAAPITIGFDYDGDDLVSADEPTFDVDLSAGDSKITTIATYTWEYPNLQHLVVRHTDGTTITIAPNE